MLNCFWKTTPRCLGPGLVLRRVVKLSHQSLGCLGAGPQVSCPWLKALAGRGHSHRCLGMAKALTLWMLRARNSAGTNVNVGVPTSFLFWLLLDDSGFPQECILSSIIFCSSLKIHSSSLQTQGESTFKETAPFPVQLSLFSLLITPHLLPIPVAGFLQSSFTISLLPREPGRVH